MRKPLTYILLVNLLKWTFTIIKYRFHKLLE
jgi:hypothetical protein